MFKNGGILLRKKDIIPTGIDNNSVLLYLNEDGVLCYIDSMGYKHLIGDSQTIPQLPLQLQYDQSSIPADYDSLMVSTNTFFGDGSDGVVELNSLLELDRDYYFESLQLNVGGMVKSNGFRVFVKETLTFNGGTIQNNGNDGSSSNISSDNYFVGGIGGTSTIVGSLGQSNPGGNGSTATMADGPNTPTTITFPLNNGGNGGFGGNGGNGLVGQGGKSLSNRNANRCILRNVYLALQASRGIYAINGGLGADGGGAGGGDGSHFGGGGGGGGAGGGVIQIIAKYIIATPNSAYPSIIANGGNGENGKNALCGNCGGGGGGSGGGGGFIQLFYLQIPVTSITNLIVAKPGNYGIGGNGIGNASSGSNGNVGQPGYIECINVKTGVWNTFTDSSNALGYK